MDEPCLIATVGIVVDGEQVAEIVEGELLRIAEARGEELEAGAVGMATKHGATAGIVVRLAVEGDLVATVADREVDPSIGPHHEAMEVVTAEGNPDTVPG